MSVSRMAHAAADGTDLYAVPSLASLRSLNAAKIDGLRKFDIDCIGDLLHFKPVHHAELLRLAGEGRLRTDLDRNALLRREVRGLDARELLTRPPAEVLSDVSADDRAGVPECRFCRRHLCARVPRPRPPGGR